MNEIIKNEINEKGFCVYNYISFEELFLTVKKDYLTILDFINIPFGVIGVFLFTLNPLFGLGFLGIGYLIIMIILFLKLIFRSYHFLLISDVIFTKKGIIIGKKTYNELSGIEEKLKNYSEMFSEELGKESNLNFLISQKKESLLHSSKKSGEKVLDFVRGVDAKLALLAIIGVGIYSIFLYVFYYIGYFLGILFFFIFGIFLKIIIKLTKNKEIEIKNQTIEIDNNFKKLNEIFSLISEKYKNFNNGEISDLSDFTNENFKNFYNQINLSLKNKDKLINILNNYKYKDFIDFPTLELYIKSNFNKPINEMLKLLENTQKNITSQLEELNKTKSQSIEFKGQLEQKEVILNHQLELIGANKTKFKSSLL